MTLLELARECKRKGWNHQVRILARNYGRQFK